MERPREVAEDRRRGERDPCQGHSEHSEVRSQELSHIVMSFLASVGTRAERNASRGSSPGAEGVSAPGGLVRGGLVRFEGVRRGARTEDDDRASVAIPPRRAPFAVSERIAAHEDAQTVFLTRE